MPFHRILQANPIALAVAFALTGPACAQGRSDTVAITGTVLPGTGGGTYSPGTDLQLIDGGQGAFSAFVVGGTTSAGLFRYSGAGTLTAVAVVGQAAPGAGAATFSFLASKHFSASGRLGIYASLTGGTSTSALYVSDSGTKLTAVALQGQSAPGAGGGTFSGFQLQQPPLVNYSGQSVFVGDISGGTSSQGLYLGDRNGALAPLALLGQTAPGTGGTFNSLPPLSNSAVFNDAGQVAVLANATGGTSSGGIYRASASGMTPLFIEGLAAPGTGGVFGGSGSFSGYAMNGAGQVAAISVGPGAKGVFRSDSGTALTTLALTGQTAPSSGSGVFSDFGGAATINQSGQSAFHAVVTGGTANGGIYRADSAGTALTAIAVTGQAAPGGSGGSFNLGLNGLTLGDTGAAVFQSSLIGGTSNSGLFVGDGRDLLAVQLQGATLAGKTIAFLNLSATQALNAQGQVAYTARFTDNTSGLFVFTPTLRWRDASGGSWDGSSSWTLGLTPAGVHDVTIDPTVSLTVTGPAANTDIRRLNIGGDGMGNNGIATLSMKGGTLNVLGAAGQFTTVTSKGVLTGDGAINGAVLNQGTVNAINLSLTGGLTNTGTVAGSGRLNTSLSNSFGGLLRVGAGQLLSLTGSTHANAGGVEVRGGGEFQVTGTFTNASAGTVLVDSSIARFNSAFTNAAGASISLSNGTAYFNGGLGNSGQLQVSFGGGTVFGAVTDSNGGKLILTGNSNTTFYGSVDVQAGGELRTSTGSTAVFFGPVFERTGSLFTGTGTKFYEGGLSVGSSPGYGVDSGNVNFDAGNLYTVDIGGITACTAACGTDAVLRNSSYDKYVVAGHLGLGGTLKLGNWNGFVPQAGQRFDLLDWGSASGGFDNIDANGLLLAAGTALDTSRLSIDGTLSVVAVPEPGAWVMLLAGLVGVAAARSRTSRNAGRDADRASRSGCLGSQPGSRTCTSPLAIKS